MNQVVIPQKIYDEAVSMLAQAGFEVNYPAADAPLALADLKTAVSEAHAILPLLTDKISAEVMDAAPKLRVIANVAVGYDNIDVSAATERGIIVTNTPDVLTETTADLAFALLLAIARRIPEADAYMRAGKYKGFELFAEMIGIDVYGKTLGIVGMGRIGTAVARRAALGFNMRVLYTAKSPKPEAEQNLGAQRVEFDTLLRQSDFISINTPLNAKTRHLFTLNEFRKMKPTACIINTARGPIIKEADLVQALALNIIRGAALDVFEKEPLLHPGLAQFHDRLIVVPHVGSATVETRRRMATLAAENAIAALQGRRPPNPVNPEVVG
ncbi:MAG: D-glycerate dehydrogenase [Anaerolineales bacterium]|nr:D-glycerate dehydrogenase [Anaerolineales bacterium]